MNDGKWQRTAFAYRASQLDAQRLDEEVVSLLVSQAKWSLRYCNQRTGTYFTPELRFILRAVLFWNSVWKNMPSPGQVIHNLHLRSALLGSGSAGDSDVLVRREEKLSLLQRLVLIFVDTLLPYIWYRVHSWMLDEEELAARWRDETLSRSWRRLIWRSMNACETLHRAVAAANYVMFLSNGRFPSLAYRIAQVNMFYTDVSATRAVSFEFVNRQLVWSGFADFLVFLTPVLRSAQVLRVFQLFSSRISSFISQYPHALIFSRPDEGEGSTAPPSDWSQAANSQSGLSAEGDENRNHAVSRLACSLCNTSTPRMAHRALPCRHVYCYICIAVARERDPWFVCRQCNITVHAISRVEPLLKL